MKKNRGGQFLVMTIVLVSCLAAWGTRMHYNARHPASIQARLVTDGQVVAGFAPDAQKIIRQGMRATISLQGKKFNGIVGSNAPEANAFFVKLTALPVGMDAGTPCKVIVDTTVPPELLKDE